MTVSISCIITSFNNSRWLKGCVESVLSQTLLVDEIIIADDASTDGSQNLIKALAAQHPNIRPVLREKNLGVGANRDGAIRLANSHLVATLDGDDFYYPEKIEKEIAALANDLEDAVAFSDFNRLDDKDVVHMRTNLSEIAKLDRNQFLQYLLFRKGALPRDMLFPKQLFLKTGGYRQDLKIYEDWDIKLRMARDAGKWVHSGTVGLGHRHHASGLSNVHVLVDGEWRTKVLFANRNWLEPIFGHDIFSQALEKIAYETAGRCAQTGELVHAERICRDLLRSKPGHPGVLQLLGVIEHQRKLPGK